MKKLILIALTLIAGLMFTSTNAATITSKSVMIPEGSKSVKICATFKGEAVKNYWIVYVKMGNVKGWYNTMIKPTGAKVNLPKSGWDGVYTSDDLVAGKCWRIPLGTPVPFAADKYTAGTQYVMKTLPTGGKLTYYVSRPSNLVNTIVYYTK